VSAYSVQTGAYIQKENALDMVVKLRGMGYAPRVLVLKDKKGRVWHAVRLGAYSTRADAKRAAAELAAKEGMPALARPYNAL
jgi:cell division septation protein DedD